MTTALSRLQKAHSRVSKGVHTFTDLARIVAIEHKGWKGCPGGYIKTGQGRAVTQGWDDLANLFRRQGILKANTNGTPCVDWPKLNTSTI